MYMYVLQLFVEHIALPPSAIRIRYYDFERPVNSTDLSSSLGLVQLS
jgi:hypothetical protein